MTSELSCQGALILARKVSREDNLEGAPLGHQWLIISCNQVDQVPKAPFFHPYWAGSQQRNSTKSSSVASVLSVKKSRCKVHHSSLSSTYGSKSSTKKRSSSIQIYSNTTASTSRSPMSRETQTLLRLSSKTLTWGNATWPSPSKRTSTGRWLDECRLLADLVVTSSKTRNDKTGQGAPISSLMTLGRREMSNASRLFKVSSYPSLER